MPAPVVESIAELVGDTPLVRLRLSSAGASVWAKCEHLEPSGSVKDRVASALVERALRDGRLATGGAIVVASSGSMGAALALAAIPAGHAVVVAMPASMSLEKRSLLRALGAELVLTDAELGMAGAHAAAARLATERNAFLAREDRELLAQAHARTAEEIVAALGGVPEVLVAAVGSGATIVGVGQALRARGSVRIVAIIPSSSETRLAGLSLDDASSLADEVRTISDQAAWQMKERLAREEGLLVGPSSGANVAIACAIAETLPASARVVTFLCDTGERYFSVARFFAEAAP